MMEPVKVGVVGVGHMGQYHMKTYAEMRSVELFGVADIDESRAKEVAHNYNVRWHLDYNDLIGSVDAVSIAVPTSSHYEVAKDFLEAGVHVLLEKPMTAEIKEAEELIAIARRKGALLQIGHVERFNAAVGELRRIVRDPFCIDANRLGPYNPRVKDVGVVMDLMVHDIDIVLGLVDSGIKEIATTGISVISEHEDVASVQILFENGCIANLTASRVAGNKQRTLALAQEGAYIFLDYIEQDIAIGRQAYSSFYPPKGAETYPGQETHMERLSVHKVDQLKMEIKHFLECAAGRARPMVSLENELRLLEVAVEVLHRMKDSRSRRSSRIGLGLYESIRGSAR